jgi:glutathione peroxidase
MSQTLHDFKAKTINGKEISLEDFKGKLKLVVNTASQCGFTPQYKGLEELYKKHQDKLVVLGFPCNQFGKQEPGDSKDISSFCEINYGVSFPIFSKVDVNGESADPIFKFLKHEAPGFLGTEFIKWNFTKFLVDRDGKVVKRYSTMTKPEEIEKDLEKYL